MATEIHQHSLHPPRAIRGLRNGLYHHAHATRQQEQEKDRYSDPGGRYCCQQPRTRFRGERMNRFALFFAHFDQDLTDIENPDFRYSY